MEHSHDIPHYFRPPDGYEWLELFRYGGGMWPPDDGERDLAFVGKAICAGSVNWFPYGVHTARYDSWNPDDEEHPNIIAEEAMSKFGLARYGCLNGITVK